MPEHYSADNYPVTVGAKFWNNDLRVCQITEVAPRPGLAYSDTGCIQTWHYVNDGNGRTKGMFDTMDGSMRQYSRLARYFQGKDAEKYEPGTNYADIKGK